MKRVLMLSTVASLQDQFNMANIRMLRNLHCDVHVACNFVQGNNTSPQRIAVFQNELAALGVTCHQIDFARSPFHLLQNHRAYQQLKAVLRADTFDCIHCHTPVGGIYGRKAAAAFQIPVIYTAHGFHFFQGAPLWNWLLFYPVEKYYARKTDVLITINSEDYDRAVRKMHAKQVVRIPGVGLKPGKYRFASRSREEVREALDLPLDAILLISVGELNRNKNHRVIFRRWHACRSCRYTIYYAGRVRKQNFCRSLPRVYTSLIGCGFWDIGRMSVICCTLQIFSVSHPNGKGWAWQHWRQWKLVCRWSLPIFMAFGTIPSAVKRDLPAQYRMWRNLLMRLKRSPKTATSGNGWGHIISRQ